MKKVPVVLLALFAFVISKANNINVSNSSIAGQNTVSHTEKINFDISWENSWRIVTNQNNYDGAWVFVKFRKTGTAAWRHCTISSTAFAAGTGSTITVSPDSVGFFINRANTNLGTGNVSFLNNQVQWNYGADGVLDNETVEIKVFAVEMVYIPTGIFSLGSGGTEVNAFQNGSTGTPFLVTDNTITFGSSAGSLNATGIPTGTLPVAYPRGTKAFWIMKYECTEQQYVDFLNHLTSPQAATNYTPTDVITGTYPNRIAAHPERAIGNLGYRAAAALADWSGLRPYTEMEFEKVCRGGNIAAVPNEYVWGTNIFTQLLSVSNAGMSNEAVSTPADANVNMTGYGSPVRAGLFARAAASTRILSGSSYYGVMNMADNVAETVVNVSDSGILFNGAIHGNGYLNAAGNSDISNWQSGLAFGLRGSAYGNLPYDCARTSDRLYAPFYFSGPDQFLDVIGIRLARTAQ
jgi:formylglycine-generating enzyme required for sulfatase activity